MLETFNVPAMYVTVAPTLSLYGTGHMMGEVVGCSSCGSCGGRCAPCGSSTGGGSSCMKLDAGCHELIEVRGYNQLPYSDSNLFLGTARSTTEGGPP